MNIVVIGKNGQLARALERSAPKGVDLSCLGSGDFNIHDEPDVRATLSKLEPQWIINAAAYTAVDKAETDKEAAYALNAEAPQLLAETAKALNADFIHISTDFVFDGKQGSPYKCDQPTNPLNVYGQSKLNGELAVLATLPTAAIIRTSWVFSEFGNNFVKTMIRLMSERPALNVVDDQIGSPTSATDLAQFIFQVTALRDRPSGILHWTNAGVCSWYDFAVAIQSIALDKGLIKQPCTVTPIPGVAYPTPAARPHYSVLDKQKAWDITATARHWQQALNDVITQLEGLTHA